MKLVCPLPAGPRLEGLESALDADTMRHLIESHLVENATLLDCRPVYVRYKDLDGALIGWRVDTLADEERHESYVTARSAPLWRLRSEAERLKNRIGEVWHGLRSLTLIEQEHLLLLAFPVDRMLRDLRRMLRASRIRSLVLSEFPQIIDAGLRFSKRRSFAQLVRYKPERRAVLRWSLAMVDGSSAVARRAGIYVRVHADHVGSGATQSLRARAAAGIRCPRPLAVPHDRLVIESEVAGKRLDELSPPCCELVGTLLASLHGVEPPRALPVHSGVEELDTALKTCADLRRLDPELGQLADSIADQLSRWIPSAPEPRFSHGDFHRGQLLLGPTGLGVVDLDRSLVGHPARDLANFYAHEIGLDGARAPETCSEIERAYGQRTELPPHRELAWYKACSVLRFAMTPFRTLMHDWPERAHFLLERAAELTGEARS
jgi:streptomycin 6-kinase